jgi:hypothetical protein
MKWKFPRPGVTAEVRPVCIDEIPEPLPLPMPREEVERERRQRLRLLKSEVEDETTRTH